MLHLSCSSAIITCSLKEYKNSKPFMISPWKLIYADGNCFSDHLGAPEELVRRRFIGSEPESNQDVGSTTNGRARPRIRHKPELFCNSAPPDNYRSSGKGIHCLVFERWCRRWRCPDFFSES